MSVMIVYLENIHISVWILCIFVSIVNISNTSFDYLSIMLFKKCTLIFPVLRPRIFDVCVYGKQKKKGLHLRKPELSRRVFAFQTGQNQYLVLQAVVASYAFMTSEAFFSETALD
jgi:hypothetical protein